MIILQYHDFIALNYMSKKYSMSYSSKYRKKTKDYFVYSQIIFFFLENISNFASYLARFYI